MYNFNELLTFVGIYLMPNQIPTNAISSPVNAVASQLAVDQVYYEEKSQECFEILSQLNEWVDTEPCQITFYVFVNDKPLSTLPIPLTAWDTVFAAVVCFYNHYRTKAQQTRSALNDIKNNMGIMPC